MNAPPPILRTRRIAVLCQWRPVSTAPLPRWKNLRKAAADAASSDDEAPEAVRNAEARDDHLRQAEAEAAKPAPKAKKSRKRDRERGLRHAEHLADERAEARRGAAPVSQSLPRSRVLLEGKASSRSGTRGLDTWQGCRWDPPAFLGRGPILGASGTYHGTTRYSLCEVTNEN